MGAWPYQESNFAAAPLREAYDVSLQRLVAARRRQLQPQRQANAAAILRDPCAARARLVEMLGWPLTDYTPAQPLRVDAQTLYRDEQLWLQRLQLHFEQDFTFGGLLFLHADGAQRPLVLCQHGGSGTPELCAGLLRMGSVNYNDMVLRAFSMGAHVFAPQLYLWDTGLFGCCDGQQGRPRDELRRSLDVSLKNLGGSIMAVELAALRRAIDYLLAQPFVLPGALGMSGLSYGGQYALFLPAVEPRIAASLSSCFFNQRERLEWSDYTWFGAAGAFLDEEVALLVRPRKLFLQAASRDEVFSAKGAQQAWEELQRLSADDLSWVDFRLFEGVHEFDRDDGQLRALMQALYEAAGTPPQV